jgi:perosamine synthetase
VFVDTDPESYLMDPKELDALVNERTKAIMPVHIGGSTVDMDGVMNVARKHNIAVVEDACQAWMAQWRGKNVGRIGNAGCFSFQATKNLNCGEGGAIISDDRDFLERCYAFHNQGFYRGRPRYSSGDSMSGTNLRLTEFQAAVLLVQLSRMEEQQRTREQNAAYLSSLLKDIPGIRPAKMYEGCTRNSYHIYMAHYDKAHFAGMPREKFIKALAAEGAPFRSSYGSHRNFGFLRNLPQDRAYKALFGEERLKQWEKQSFNLPRSEQVFDEHVWFGQAVLLSERSVMDRIAEAVRKVHKHAAELAKA